MKDFEIREFTDTQEVNALEYFKEQENTDRWVRVYTNEMETAPLENCRLKLLEKDAFSYTSRNGINIPYFSKDVNEDDITSSMENSKLSLVFPDRIRCKCIQSVTLHLVIYRTGLVLQAAQSHP